MCGSQYSSLPKRSKNIKGKFEGSIDSWLELQINATSYNTQILALNRKHKQLTALACARKLIGLPKVKFLISPSGGSDKNREGGKQIADWSLETGRPAPGRPAFFFAI